MSKLDSLGKKATSGIFWSALERVGQQGVSFFVQIVLARLLAPEQFMDPSIELRQKATSGLLWSAFERFKQ